MIILEFFSGHLVGVYVRNVLKKCPIVITLLKNVHAVLRLHTEAMNENLEDGDLRLEFLILCFTYNLKNSVN